MSEEINWQEKAAQLGIPSELYIDGAFKAASSSKSLKNTNPANGEDGFEFAVASTQDVDFAVISSRNAYQNGWDVMGPGQRSGILKNFANLVEQNADKLALCDSLDVGKLITSAVREVGFAAGFIRYYAEAIDKIHSGQVVPTSTSVIEMQVMRSRGVVGAVIPWNFPVINVALKVGPALAAGNTVVIKPSELSPRSSLLMAQIATEAGLPAGVFNVVTGDGDTGKALVSHTDVDMLTFTGSTETGKSVLSAIGSSSIKPVLLECGGKSPEVIFPDVASYGIRGLAEQIVRGGMFHQGQVCVARTRVLIHRSIYDEFVEQAAEVARSIPVSGPLNMASQFGPLASEKQKQIVEGFIASGVEDGARLVVDGRNPQGGELGSYVGPTIFADVPPNARIAQQEIFGPVLALFPFEDEAEALALANDTANGLAATVWTKDIVLAKRFASKLKVGKVKVIAAPGMYEGAGFNHSAEPCGQSGYGVEGGLDGMRAYMRKQSIELVLGE